MIVNRPFIVKIHANQIEHSNDLIYMDKHRKTVKADVRDDTKCAIIVLEIDQICPGIPNILHTFHVHNFHFN